MRCIGGISILFVIYEMWWNLNPACNIFYKDTLYTLFIFCFSSVMGKRKGLTNPGRLCYGQETRTNEPALLCYGQETRTNEPASLLLWAR
jgi:hypothetical protein